MKAFNKFIDLFLTPSCYLYSVCVCVCFQDDDDQLTVVTDRSQGGGSINNGSLEIMVIHMHMQNVSMSGS